MAVPLPIHEEFGCVGYYGFGSGVELSRLASKQRVHGEDLYCGRCPLKGDCWLKHRDRVRKFVPDLMAMIDEIIATGTLGPELIREYQRRLDAELPGQAPHTDPTPDLTVMAGNLQDGARVASGLAPEERGHLTLRLPFGN